MSLAARVALGWQLLAELVSHFAVLSLEDREAILQLTMPWLKALAAAFDKAGAADPLTSLVSATSHEALAATSLTPVLHSLFGLSRLTAMCGRQGGTAESAHMAFLVEAAWAAVVSPGSTPHLVPALVSLLVECHVAASAAVPTPDVREQQLCARALLLACRTPCAPVLVRSVLAQLRNYGHVHCPPVESPALWLRWRADRPACREPLTPSELVVIPMLKELPYEVRTRPHSTSYAGCTGSHTVAVNGHVVHSPSHG